MVKNCTFITVFTVWLYDICRHLKVYFISFKDSRSIREEYNNNLAIKNQARSQKCVCIAGDIE